MRTKDEAFEFVRDLILRLKNELPQAMRAIRSDNGTEFKNEKIESIQKPRGHEEDRASFPNQIQHKVSQIHGLILL